MHYMLAPASSYKVDDGSEAGVENDRQVHGQVEVEFPQ